LAVISGVWWGVNPSTRTYLLTPWSRGHLEKLTSFHIVKKLLAFYDIIIINCNWVDTRWQ